MSSLSPPQGDNTEPREPLPCRFCGAPIARDATADWFTTIPGADAPWTCPVNPGGHAPDASSLLAAKDRDPGPPDGVNPRSGIAWNE